MSLLKRYSCCGALACLLAGGAYAQVTSINSVAVTKHAYNDVPSATTTVINSYPSVLAVNEFGVSAPAPAFANRDVWQFSANGTSPYQFQPNDYFVASMDLTLVGSPITPRKEAGWLFSTTSSGDIQFIVDTDGHEVVQFGGISFYSFSANNIVSYNSGQTIHLGLSYFQDASGKNALQFSANGNLSPVFEFGPTVGSHALDIGTGSTLGGYLQVDSDPANPANGGTALFQNMTITPAPEPSVLALLVLGVPLLFRRRS
ncbi:MAG TPA: hypothetical protein VN829_11860 [Dongiaceae bacterium]|nr:hypothetical protein [Dongiaceae bacterium]